MTDRASFAPLPPSASDPLHPPASPGQLEVAQHLRRHPTRAERALWEHVRGQPVPGLSFQRQSIVGGYLADFYCPELRLVIELDGPRHARRALDLQRDRTMRWLGVRVARVTNEEIVSDVAAVVARLVAEARSSPVTIGARPAAASPGR